MAEWRCPGCSSVYSVGAPACPQCGTADPIENTEGQVATISRTGGPSSSELDPDNPGETRPVRLDLDGNPLPAEGQPERDEPEGIPVDTGVDESPTSAGKGARGGRTSAPSTNKSTGK